jgi:hypothetical protein
MAHEILASRFAGVENPAIELFFKEPFAGG